METLLPFGVAVAITLAFVLVYMKNLKKRDARARQAAEKRALFSDGPRAQHPHIDNNRCIGCATCTTVCPEGDVLAILGGKAAIVNGYDNSGSQQRGQARSLFPD